jgi:hypothetical protein
MAIKYSVVQQKYDITGQNILKFFAKAQASGQTDFATICETISDRGTVTKGDVMASIDGCIYAMKTALKEGRIVRLGEFGSFQIGVSSEGIRLCFGSIGLSIAARFHLFYWRPSRPIDGMAIHAAMNLKSITARIIQKLKKWFKRKG